MAQSAAEDTIESKLLAARTRLIVERPFLGALVLRLPLEAADPAWCQRTFTDGKALFYNPKYIAPLSFAQTQFVLSADALCCALLHSERRGQRDPIRWERACAYSVNQILIDEGLKPPPDAWVNSDYQGMAAEEIYPLLNEPNPSSGRARQGQGRPQGSEPAQDARRTPLPPSATEQHDLQQKWQRRLAGAAQQALQAGKLSSAMLRLVDLVLQPTLPWRAVLARYLNSVARDDFSYSRPSSRRGDPAIFPSLRSTELNLVVAVDVSGSIDEDEFGEFMTEVDALKAQIRARVTLLTCDSAITDESPWIFEAWETCRLPERVMGGGATDFRPVFEWVASQDRQPDVLIYFTDAAGRFPALAPAYDVLWLIKGSRAVPWGQRIQLT